MVLTVAAHSAFAQETPAVDVTPDAPKPRPLGQSGTLMSSSDARLYRDIFTLQKDGKWQDANEKINDINDLRLMGHVMFQRYMHPTLYRASYEELEGWLALYGDHPYARDVYDLAISRKPHAAINPPKARATQGIVGNLGHSTHYAQNYISPKKRSSAQKAQVKKIKAQVNDYLRRRAPTKALTYLGDPAVSGALDVTEIDLMKGQIALSYFYLDRLEKAYKAGSEAADRSGIKAPLAAWMAGLAAWKKKDYEASARYFEIAANSKHLSPWTASASAYWASRAYWRIREPQKVNAFLRMAAQHPRTFYGLIAIEALGRPIEAFEWAVPTFKDKHRDIILKSSAAGERALLLEQAGQIVLAEKELAQIHPRGDSELEEALLAYAYKNGFAGLAMRLASAIKSEDGKIYDGVFFPVSDWEPEGGYKIDKAFIHALIRQESRFNPHAESPSGARGLMQLLPSTASHVADENFKGKNRYKLLDPEVNLSIGQDYIEELLKSSDVNGDMFKLAIAYNAGPGNLRRWLKKIDHDDDPLYFIESIPVAETRAYIEHVMTNFWIYRMRFDQDIPSLRMVAAGEWPSYVSLENESSRFARQ